MPPASLKRLTWIFLRVGNLTFGGGDPTMAALQSELVVTRRWLSAEQYALIYGLARKLDQVFDPLHGFIR